MTIPVWVLLAFSMWTLLVLALTVGVQRWSRILSRRARFEEFAFPDFEGKGLYARSMRAHLNCVENLPVYGGLALAGAVAGIEARSLDVLALVFIGARVLHSIVHVAFRQAGVVVVCRSLLFNTQWACMVTMGVITALRA